MFRNNCEASVLFARPDKTKSRSSCSTPAPGSTVRSHEPKLVVSRPRASFDAGLLLPRFDVAIRRSLTVHVHLAMFVSRARSCDRGTRLCFIPQRMVTFRARFSALTSCLPSRCSCSRSSFDVRAHVHARVTAVVRSHAFARNVPRRSPCAFTTKTSWPRSPLSCRPCAPLDAHGRHALGSQSTGSRVRVTFRRRQGTDPLKIAPRSSHPAIAPVLAFRR